MVYVLNKNREPLMPCKPAVARLLLKDRKAKCIKRTPFTIQLLDETTNYTQDLTLGVDTGSSKIGSAVVNEKGEAVYLSEVEVRNDITKKMTRRAQYRRTRRTRKTRYRKPRFDNRGNSKRKGRFSPTVTSKIDSHLKEIRFVQSLFPITKVILETGSFDPHALKNPAVRKHKWMYQKGINYGYANTKAYVLTRDDYTCQNCKGSTKDCRLEVHHIVFRRNGGSDNEKNLITLCKTCHDALHRGEFTLKGGKQRGTLNHATQMNSIRIQLLKRCPQAKETFGYITKEHRQNLGLPKEHYMDAAVIASRGRRITFKTSTVLRKKCVADGDYQQTKGVRSQKVIPTGKIGGVRKFDKVQYLGNEYFVKGRMSSGYAVLMGIDGRKADFSDAPRGWKTPKIERLKRVSARDSWVMTEETIPSIA